MQGNPEVRSYQRYWYVSSQEAVAEIGQVYGIRLPKDNHWLGRKWNVQCPICSYTYTFSRSSWSLTIFCLESHIDGKTVLLANHLKFRITVTSGGYFGKCDQGGTHRGLFGNWGGEYMDVHFIIILLNIQKSFIHCFVNVDTSKWKSRA